MSIGEVYRAKLSLAARAQAYRHVLPKYARELDDTEVVWHDLSWTRLIAPLSELGFVRGGRGNRNNHHPGCAAALGTVKQRKTYVVLDWLLTQWRRIKTGLAGRLSIITGRKVGTNACTTYGQEARGIACWPPFQQAS